MIWHVLYKHSLITRTHGRICGLQRQPRQHVPIWAPVFFRSERPGSHLSSKTIKTFTGSSLSAWGFAAFLHFILLNKSLLGFWGDLLLGKKEKNLLTEKINDNQNSLLVKANIGLQCPCIHVFLSTVSHQLLSQMSPKQPDLIDPQNNLAVLSTTFMCRWIHRASSYTTCHRCSQSPCYTLCRKWFVFSKQECVVCANHQLRLLLITHLKM